MAAEQENPCCTRWKEKWRKAAEGRAHLKKATKLLQSLTDKFQQGNASLKEALEEERQKADKEREGREKEMILRATLENEISLLRRTGDADDESDEMKLLKDPVSRGEKHIVQLQKLLEEERMRVDSEKKKAEVEKKSAEEAWKLVKAERAKVDEERQRANAEEKKVEELQILLEAMKEEADKARSKLGSCTSMFDIVKCDLEAEKQKVADDRKRADLERAKTEELKKLVEELEKNVMVEKSRADGLSLQLEDARRKIENLKMAVNKRSISHCSGLVPDHRCDDNSNVNTGSWLENLMKDEDMSDLVLQFPDSDDVMRRIEAEKEKALTQKNRADMEMAGAEEQSKLAEANKKIAEEEISRADQLSLQLQESMCTIEELKKQIQELSSSKTVFEATAISSDKDAENTKIKLLEEQLNIEKKVATTENGCADLEMEKAEEYKNLAEVHRKTAMEEKAHSEMLSLELKKERHKIGELEKQVLELENTKIKLLEELTLVKRKAEEEKEHANSEMKKVEEYKMLIQEERKVTMEERAHSKKLSVELEKDGHKMGELEKQMQELENSMVKLLEELNLEKNKAEEEKERANSEMTKVEEYKMLVEVHAKVAMEERARYEKLSLELEKDRRKFGELENQMQELENTKIKLLEEQLNIEKRKAEAEKEHADSEMEKAEEYKILAEGHSKVVAEEKVHSEKLSLELEKDRHKIGEMEKQMPELFSCRKTIKACAGSPKNDINVRTKKRRVTEDRLKVDKQGLMKDEKGQDVHGVEVRKCRHLMEENKKMATEEEVCSEQLSHQISEDRRRIDEMQRQIDLLLSSQKMAGESVDLAVKKSNAKNPEVKLLERELKLEKKRLKFSKQVAEIEKGRNRLLEQELNRLKLDFMQILHRLDVMGKICSPSIEGTKDTGKVVLSMTGCRGST